jgi:glutathione peroxidase
LQSCTNQKSEISKAKTKELMGKTIYDFKVESLDGKEINFADFKGKRS